MTKFAKQSLEIFQPSSSQVMKFKFLYFFFAILLKFSSTLECGRSQVAASFSVGGEYSSRGQWPWLAPLANRADNKFFCGSTIISDRHLLSGIRWNLI